MKYKLGKLFPPAMRTTGWVFLLIGLYFLINSIMIGLISFSLVALVIFLLGYFIAITPHGIILDIENKKYKNYTSIFGYKQGTWKSYQDYPFITLIANQENTMAFSRSNRPATTSSNLYHDICLLNKTHLHKLLIKRQKDRVKAVADVKELAKILDLQLAKYQPTLSKSSQKRKLGRR